MEVTQINLDKEGEITLKLGKNEEIVELSGSGSDSPTLKARLDLVRDLFFGGQLCMFGVRRQRISTFYRYSELSR